jgi:hypothetical protein
MVNYIDKSPEQQLKALVWGTKKERERRLVWLCGKR